MTDRPCKNCGAEVTGRADKLYCKPVCRLVANKRKWRAKYPEKAREKSRRASARLVASGRNAEKCRKWREANKGKHAELNRLWKGRNPEKVKARRQRRRKAKVEEGVVEYREVMTVPGVRQVCFYCGEDCSGGFHWDHHVPIVAGGPDAPWNLVVSCPGCNCRKGAKLPQSVFCEEIFG